MNIRTVFLITLLGAVAGAARAQDLAPYKAEIKIAPKLQAVQTPMFQVSNVPAKPFRPKNWMEIDVSFDIVKAKTAPGDTSPFVDGVEFRFFIALNKMDKTNKRLLLTSTLRCASIALKEKNHLLVFVSPATLARTLDKAIFTEADVSDVGIEVLVGGQTIGAYSKINKKWWDNLDPFTVTDGAVLPKAKTPFAPLWGDYDVEVKLQ